MRSEEHTSELQSITVVNTGGSYLNPISYTLPDNTVEEITIGGITYATGAALPTVSPTLSFSTSTASYATSTSDVFSGTITLSDYVTPPTTPPTDPAVPPVIQRTVIMPQVQGIATNPAAGTHYVRSTTDFEFDMWALDGYSLSNVTVTTDRGNEIIIENGELRIENEIQNSAGVWSDNLSAKPFIGAAIYREAFIGEASSRLHVRIRHINAETTIVISGVGTVANESIDNNAFTAYPSPTDGPLTITGLTPGTTLRIFSITGTQVTALTAEAETITIDISHLARGLYLLHADGRTIRVIKN